MVLSLICCSLCGPTIIGGFTSICGQFSGLFETVIAMISSVFYEATQAFSGCAGVMPVV
jgi:hypothetical protein